MKFLKYIKALILSLCLTAAFPAVTGGKVPPNVQQVIKHKNSAIVIKMKNSGIKREKENKKRLKEQKGISPSQWGVGGAASCRKLKVNLLGLIIEQLFLMEILNIYKSRQ